MQPTSESPDVAEATRLIVGGATRAHLDVATARDRVINELRGRALDFAGELWLEKIELRTRPSILSEGAIEAAREIAVRYLGVERGDAFAAVSGDDTIIRLEPGTLRIWDFTDDYSA